MAGLGSPPTEIYKGVPIYLYQEEGMKRDEYGARFDWYGRRQEAQVEHWQHPTRANILRAARAAISLLKQLERQHMLRPDGTLKPEEGQI